MVGRPEAGDSQVDRLTRAAYSRQDMYERAGDATPLDQERNWVSRRERATGVDRILSLQATAGNRAVTRLIKERREARGAGLLQRTFEQRTDGPGGAILSFHPHADLYVNGRWSTNRWAFPSGRDDLPLDAASQGRISLTVDMAWRKAGGLFAGTAFGGHGKIVVSWGYSTDADAKITLTDATYDVVEIVDEFNNGLGPTINRQPPVAKVDGHQTGSVSVRPSMVFSTVPNLNSPSVQTTTFAWERTFALDLSSVIDLDNVTPAAAPAPVSVPAPTP